MTNVSTGWRGVNTDRPDLTGSDAGAALTQLYDAHARDLHRYLARRRDVATADDLVAETYLVAWAQRHRYDPARAPARAWLYGIATNLLRRHTRTEVNTLRALTRDGARPTPVEPVDAAAAARADAGTTTRLLAGALARLRDEDRDVLLLIAWAGLTPTEAAQALDIDPGTARTRLHRARTRLRTHLNVPENSHD